MPGEKDYGMMKYEKVTSKTIESEIKKYLS